MDDLRLCIVPIRTSWAFEGETDAIDVLVQRRSAGRDLLETLGTRRDATRPEPEAGDNHGVRSLLAVAILVVFASLNAIDGICCSDGCNHERESTSQQHGDRSGDGSCMLCLGGIDAAATPVLTPSGILTARVGYPPVMSRLDTPTDPPDHPPRA